MKGKVRDLAWAISGARILERKDLPEDFFALKSTDCTKSQSGKTETFTCKYEPMPQ